MKVEFWMTGKTSQSIVKKEIDRYSSRINKYIPFEIKELKIPKEKTAERIIIKESEIVLSNLKVNDFLIILDEKGKEFTSIEFAKQLQTLFNRSGSRLIFLVGGAYGFSNQIYKRSNLSISLSRMTFTHEMIRIFFTEQLYRALTIINNHPYHN
ncbi:MAG: 23S rRNA (pseudouridine(1915)-N(3))-methyltransferase RlmH [Bacteroidota bacterium]|nr:23S rRNA (pseudouridine(1915)-N(3))-methyltransferase RlmH [Bacteroidota bacterium]